MATSQALPWLRGPWNGLGFDRGPAHCTSLLLRLPGRPPNLPRSHRISRQLLTVPCSYSRRLLLSYNIFIKSPPRSTEDLFQGPGEFRDTPLLTTARARVRRFFDVPLGALARTNWPGADHTDDPFSLRDLRHRKSSTLLLLLLLSHRVPIKLHLLQWTMASLRRSSVHR